MKKACLVIIFIALVSCRAPDPSAPRVEITKIPMAEIGGTVRLETIAGRVFNTNPKYQIVLYTKSSEWYVQPFIDKPFTKIESDSQWSSPTHLGTEYAALIVTPEFNPPAKVSSLPEKGDGIIAIAIVDGTPMYWQTWWFKCLLALPVVLLIIAIYRLRLQQVTREMKVRFEERLAERTRIAQELHDSLLQGFVGISMQLDVAIDHLDDSPAKQQLSRVVERIGETVEEGRNTVRGLRSSDEKILVNLEQRFLQIKQDLDIKEKINFQFTEKGAPRKLRDAIADDVYHISREALINTFKHSKASRVEIEVEYGSKHFRIIIRDNGGGIAPQTLSLGRKGHWGLSVMRERAKNVGANLTIASNAEVGTEVEVSVPSHIAFEANKNNGKFKWIRKILHRKASNFNSGRRQNT